MCQNGLEASSLAMDRTHFQEVLTRKPLFLSVFQKRRFPGCLSSSRGGGPAFPGKALDHGQSLGCRHKLRSGGVVLDVGADIDLPRSRFHPM